MANETPTADNKAKEKEAEKAADALKAKEKDLEKRETALKIGEEKFKADNAEREQVENAALEAAEAALGLAEDVKKLNISVSKVKFAGVKPAKQDAEKAKHEKLVAKRTAIRVAKAKNKEDMEPVDERRALITARLTKYSAKKQATNYTIEMIKAWMEELQFIQERPGAWYKGCIKAGKEPSLDDKLNAVLKSKKKK